MATVAIETKELIRQMQRGGVPAFSEKNIRTTRLLCTRLVLLARRHGKYQEQWCSVEMSDSQANLLEIAEQKAEKEMSEIAKKLGLRIHFDGDPRGFTVKLHTPSGNVHNTWGGEEIGYGIGELNG